MTPLPPNATPTDHLKRLIDIWDERPHSRALLIPDLAPHIDAARKRLAAIQEHNAGVAEPVEPTSPGILTLRLFSASGRNVENLAEALPEITVEPIPGRVYAGGLFIERCAGAYDGQWHLPLQNETVIDKDIAVLELLLYRYGASEGHLALTLDELSRLYEKFNADNGLSLGSADEHLHDPELTPEQRLLLYDFCEVWEAVRASPNPISQTSGV
jgi:hypothetical protein